MSHTNNDLYIRLIIVIFAADDHNAVLILL